MAPVTGTVESAFHWRERLIGSDRLWVKLHLTGSTEVYETQFLVNV
jgi:hypothetical protein